MLRFGRRRGWGIIEAVGATVCGVKLAQRPKRAGFGTLCATKMHLVPIFLAAGVATAAAAASPHYMERAERGWLVSQEPGPYYGLCGEETSSPFTPCEPGSPGCLR